MKQEEIFVGSTKVEAQEINWEYVEELNQRAEFGWSEWYAYLSEDKRAVYFRRNNGR